MKGYGLASWLKKEEYKNYFVTASHLQTDDMSIRLNKINRQVDSGHDVLARAGLANLCKWITVGNYAGNMGIIAAGMEDGSVMMWDIDTLYKEGDIFAEGTQTSALISAQLVHEGGSVNAIEFNPNIQNLVASGGEEVLIQDIQHGFEDPNVFTPGEPNYHEGAKVTSVSWNKTVPYILASAANNGTVVVWDLKNSKAIFNLKDPNLASYNYDPFSGTTEGQPTANYKVIWSLKVPTQFLICNDNETMTMWDLRKIDTPIVSLSDIHSSGVLSCDWCPQDKNIIASSSEDGKTWFFHSETGDLISEIQDGKKYIDIEWSQYNRGLILGCTNEDETKIFDFNKATSKDEAAATNYAPSWLYRPVGARFGFGGKLVTFSSNPQEPIKLYQTQTAPEICAKLQQIEKMREKEELTTIIDTYIEKSGSNEIEKMEWATIRSLCTKNYDSIFTLLDIDKDSVLNEAERFSGKKKLKPKVAQKDSLLKTPNRGLDDLDANQANEFFATLAETSEKRKEEEDKKIETKVGQKTIQETVSRNSNWDEGAEGIIKRNLLIGNIEGAAEWALKCGRTTEALLLALSSPNEQIFDQIKEEYFSHSKDTFISSIIKGIVDDEIEELVLELAQNNWKEALAYTLSYTTQPTKINEYVEKIAELVLNKKRDVNSAIICYMISNNIVKLAELWKVRAELIIKKNPKHKYSVYCNYAEKITFYRLATGIKTPIEECDIILTEFAEFLINEGLPEIAYRYLDLNWWRSEKSQQIRHRAYFSSIKMINEFNPPVYKTQKHQLPKIVPRQQPGGVQVNRGFRQPVVQRGQNVLAGNPQTQNQFTPQAQNQFTPQAQNQFTPQAQNQFTPQKQNLKQTTVQNNSSFESIEKKNKLANFGYSTTDPLLLSETEDSKVDFNPKKHNNKKQRPQAVNQPDNTHIFDPSKATNMPPPPKIRHPHGDAAQSQEFSNMPVAQPYTAPQVRTSQATFEPPRFANEYREPEPVIAATNVKPPTAQMKPKVARPVQRYAPPPRLHGIEHDSQPVNAMPAPVGQPMNRPVTGPPMRGRGAPPARGRGAPPMAGRGGGASVTRSPVAQAPAPFPQGGTPGGMQQPGMQPGAPPPPKIGRRGGQ